QLVAVGFEVLAWAEALLGLDQFIEKAEMDRGACVGEGGQVAFVIRLKSGQGGSGVRAFADVPGGECYTVPEGGCGAEGFGHEPVWIWLANNGFGPAWKGDAVPELVDLCYEVGGEKLAVERLSGAFLRVGEALFHQAPQGGYAYGLPGVDCVELG